MHGGLEQQGVYLPRTTHRLDHQVKGFLEAVRFQVGLVLALNLFRECFNLLSRRGSQLRGAGGRARSQVGIDAYSLNQVGRGGKLTWMSWKVTVLFRLWAFGQQLADGLVAGGLLESDEFGRERRLVNPVSTNGGGGLGHLTAVLIILEAHERSVRFPGPLSLTRLMSSLAHSTFPLLSAA